MRGQRKDGIGTFNSHLSRQDCNLSKEGETEMRGMGELGTDSSLNEVGTEIGFRQLYNLVRTNNAIRTQNFCVVLSSPASTRKQMWGKENELLVPHVRNLKS